MMIDTGIATKGDDRRAKVQQEHSERNRNENRSEPQRLDHVRDG